MASGGRTSLLDLIAGINGILGTNIVPRHEAPRVGDVRHSQADITRTRVDLGFELQVGLKDGLRRAIDHYRKTG